MQRTILDTPILSREIPAATNVVIEECGDEGGGEISRILSPSDISRFLTGTNHASGSRRWW